MADPRFDGLTRDQIVEKILKDANKYSGSVTKGVTDSLYGGMAGRVIDALDLGMSPDRISEYLSKGSDSLDEVTNRLRTYNQSQNKDKQPAAPGYKWVTENGVASQVKDESYTPSGGSGVGSSTGHTRIVDLLIKGGFISEANATALDNDPEGALTLAKAAGLLDKNSSGSTHAPPSPLDIAQAKRLEDLNDPNYPPGALVPVSPGRARLNGTAETFSTLDPTNWQPIAGMPGYMSNGTQVIDSNDKVLAQQTLAETIRAHQSDEGWRRDQLAQLDRQNNVTNDLSQQTLDETIRRNTESGQFSRAQLAQQMRESDLNRETQQTNARNQEVSNIAKMQADPGNFVQREFTIRGLTAPSGNTDTTYTGRTEPVTKVTPAGTVEDYLKRISTLLPASTPTPRSSAPSAPSAPTVMTPISNPQGPASGSTGTNYAPAYAGGPLIPAWAVSTPKMATGGMTTAPQFITGDPQAGQPMGNPEMINNPTGAPIGVTPLSDMAGGQGMMGGNTPAPADPKDTVNPASEIVITVSKIMSLIGKMIKPGETDEVARDVGMILMSKLGNTGPMDAPPESVAMGQSQPAPSPAPPSGMPSPAGQVPQFAYGTGNNYYAGDDIPQGSRIVKNNQSGGYFLVDPSGRFTVWNGDPTQVPLSLGGLRPDFANGINPLQPADTSQQVKDDAEFYNMFGFHKTPDTDVNALPTIRNLSNPYSPEASSTSPTFKGAFNTQLPEGRSMNYGQYLRTKADPTSYGLVSSLYRSGSRNLDSEANISKQFAPIGDASSSRVIRS